MKTMCQKIFGRGSISFCAGITVNILIVLCVTAATNRPDFYMVVPDFAERFQNPVTAILVQALLCGVISGVFGMCSVIFDLDKLSFFIQGVLHFCITSLVWMPLAALLWGVAKYRTSFLSTICSFSITYLITWVAQYLVCKKHIQKINERLVELHEGNSN